MHFLSICIFFWITCPNMVTLTNLGTKGDNTAHLHCYLSKNTTVSFQHEGKLLIFTDLMSCIKAKQNYMLHSNIQFWLPWEWFFKSPTALKSFKTLTSSTSILQGTFLFTMHAFFYPIICQCFMLFINSSISCFYFLFKYLIFFHVKTRGFK